MSSKPTLHDANFQPDFILRVTEEDVPFACEGLRKSVVINGTSLGPELRLRPNSTTWVRVYNDMDHLNTTIHWHGLAQRVAPFSDGTPLASQWPIPPRYFFDYQLFVEPDDAGTYFYHAHIGMQAITAAGALIVEDNDEPPYQYDDERTIIFSDFFNKTDDEMEQGLLAVPFKWTGETNAVLLNGKGISKLRQGLNGTLDFNSTEICQLPVIDVDPGKTYRFRFIGSTALSHVLAGFEGHPDLEIINIEGHYTKPYTVQHMQLGSGERFDILFRTKSWAELLAEGRDSYFIQFETRDRPESITGFGIIRYNPMAIPPTPPSSGVITLPKDIYDWAEYSLEPLYPDYQPCPSASEVTRRIVLNTTQMNDISRRIIWSFNNLTWSEATFQSPLLVDVYKRGEAALPSYSIATSEFQLNATYPQGYDPNVKAFPVRNGEVIEIIFQNTGSLVNFNGGVDVHPFHIHGKHYCDIGSCERGIYMSYLVHSSGPGAYDWEENEKKIASLNWTPIQRDTAMLYRYETRTTAGAPAGWRAVRIKMDQPGVWMVHCHVLQHMVMGMQMVWTVGSAEDILKIPTELAAGYLEYGGSSYGNETYSPVVWDEFDGEKDKDGH
ncbi:ascorbate oxidase [Bimuria novae-zelandiae CBS 107.79]|uniref:Ascorbate oxidase n=1 Tax=Bimuria novae-zelandiae CBS 107.79 TaxID=1447943 RepID=A0A6A5UT62_9PLEO|nr:ascorbate oxidase [Bimuria novae-zelandiae CBS 107.79]